MVPEGSVTDVGRRAMTARHRFVRALSVRPSPLAQALIVLGCVALAVVARMLLHPVVGTGVPFVTVFPAVVVASVWGGVRAGAATMVLGAILASYLWLEPIGTAELTKLGTASLIAFLIAALIILACAHLLHAALAMAREAEMHAGLVAREMQHRIGNILALVQAVARLSARSADSLPEFEEQFHGRLRALAEAQTIARAAPDLPTALEALLGAVLRPFDEQRIALDGPPTSVAERDRPALALLFHELGTNAVKHGSLSVPQGRVAVTWSAGENLRIDWIESGGPPVELPSRKGFGQQIANSAFPPDRGEVTIDHDPAGLRCSITLLGGSASDGELSGCPDGRRSPDLAAS